LRTAIYINCHIGSCVRQRDHSFATVVKFFDAIDFLLSFSLNLNVHQSYRKKIVQYLREAAFSAERSHYNFCAAATATDQCRTAKTLLFARLSGIFTLFVNFRDTENRRTVSFSNLLKLKCQRSSIHRRLIHLRVSCVCSDTSSLYAFAKYVLRIVWKLTLHCERRRK